MMTLVDGGGRVVAWFVLVLARAAYQERCISRRGVSSVTGLGSALSALLLLLEALVEAIAVDTRNEPAPEVPVSYGGRLAGLPRSLEFAADGIGGATVVVEDVLGGALDLTLRMAKNCELMIARCIQSRAL